ncbi:hypothetical protein MUU72_10290 [Streptomyces sp. RS10V-4]|uniref:hypothetical protein n=1 Tax=Streptomyces rhizoryzae TaxID=2932493 RepID=UPI0020060082|nr:hypothetical protein [Streptomyces rhizoryzae]MCK7623477.1 hypothetical protein [Streptomyces rhizoryzae]
MLKHYYRLVYWKRRIARALGRRRGPGAAGAGGREAYRGGGRAPGRVRRFAVRVRPLLLFLVMVLIAVVASALLGWRDDTFGAGPREGGVVTVRPAGDAARGGSVAPCAPGDRVCAVPAAG